MFYLFNFSDYGGTTDKYTWDQTQEDVSVSVPLKKENLTGKQILCEIEANHIKVGIKGEPLILDVSNALSPTISRINTLNRASLVEK